MITVLIALVAVTRADAHCRICRATGAPDRSSRAADGARAARTSFRVNAPGPVEHCATSSGPHRIQRLRYRVPEEGPLRVRSVAASGCLLTALALGVAACGGSDNGSGGSSSSGGGGPTTLTIYSSLPLQGDSRPQSTVRRQRREARARGGRRQGRQVQDHLQEPRRLDGGGRQVGAGPDLGRRAQGRAGPVDDRLPRRVQLRRVGDLAADHQRGRHPAGLPVEHLRRPDPRRGRGQGRAGQVLPVRQAHLRPRRARRPHPGGGPGGLPEG